MRPDGNRWRWPHEGWVVAGSYLVTALGSPWIDVDVPAGLTWTVIAYQLSWFARGWAGDRAVRRMRSLVDRIDPSALSDVATLERSSESLCWQTVPAPVAHLYTGRVRIQARPLTTVPGRAMRIRLLDLDHRRAIQDAYEHEQSAWEASGGDRRRIAPAFDPVSRAIDASFAERRAAID